MINFNLILEDEEIILRPMIEEDFVHFKELCLDPEMWYYFTSDLSNEAQLKQWVDQAIDQLNKKIRLPFTVIEKSKNKVAGSTSFGSISVRDSRLEIGWTWLGKEYQGSGINKKMKTLMLKYCFETLNLERVEFKTDVLNIAARKGILKTGAVEEGILRSHTLMTNNRRRDSIFYSILKAEWEKIISPVK